MSEATPIDDARGGPALALVLLAALGVRMVALDQPIVENYVGRQTPTAMVARNLERGSGFLDPTLDVAPFPNLFLVEPPVYAAVVAELHRVSGWPLGACGRFVSALGLVLAAWGLFGLVARRSGRAAGLFAAGALAAFPVSLRYGRAFQPDALMLGCLVAGMNGWDAFEAGRRRLWLVAGFALIAAGLSLKVLSAYVLVPLVFVIARKPRPATVALAALTLAPAVLWYVHAATVLGGSGSRASADNSAFWLRAVGPAALFRAETARNVVRFLLVRAFTPLGLPLATFGIYWESRERRRLWLVWGASAFAAMAAVAGKLHHEYYWLSVAPVVAAGVGLGLVAVARRGRAGRVGAAVLATVLLVLDGWFAASTWATPAEWASLGRAAAVVRAHVSADAWVAAPEALLFAADRRGCRVEYTPASARRAAGEWWGELSYLAEAVDGPSALVAFYDQMGARYFADVTPEDASPARLALHEAIRRRYKVLEDGRGVILAELTEADHGAAPNHGPRP